MKKKITSLFLIAALALTACGGEGTKMSDRQLVIGTNELNGSFIDGWGNNSYDKQVKDLIHGYTSTFMYKDDGEYVENTQILESVEKTDDSEGNRTYTMKIKKGLKWSDGEPMTAKDYAFAVLVDASSAVVEKEGTMNYPTYFLGYEEYNETPSSEENPAFKAVGYDEKENTVSITVKAEELPYFYEYARVAVSGYPMHKIAPEATIEQTDAGAKIAGAKLVEVAETLADTYRENPDVSGGAYKFLSYSNKQVELEANEHYAGDLEGNKPKIKNILIKTIDPKRDMDTLIQGEIDVLLGLVEGEKIEKGLADDTLQPASYDRHGYGTIPLSGYYGATKDVNVRRAIAHLINKQDLVTAVTGGYGQVAFGNWSKVQWMYTKNKDKLNDDSVINKYSYNIDAANEELDKSAYRFEQDGTTAYDSSKASAEYLRYNAEGEVLKITHMGSENNVVTDTLEAQFRANYPRVGAEYESRVVDFATLLTTYYGKNTIPEADRANSFNMATGMTPIFDPIMDLGGKYADTPSVNPSGTNDEELDKLIEAMQKCDPSDKDGYADLWLKFQIRYNELMPIIPTYANTYYDFANADLEGFETGPIYNLALIISRLSWK